MVDVSMSDENSVTPLKFGNVVMDHTTLVQVQVTAENNNGSRASGLGAIFLADLWAFPSKQAIHHQIQHAAMKQLVQLIAGNLLTYREPEHPIALFSRLEHDLPALAQEARELTGLDHQLPKLAQLVCASPFDAAMHDAYGKLLGRPVFAAYGADVPGNCVGDYLGKRFADRYFSDYIRSAPRLAVPIFHLVGGLDPIHPADMSADHRLPDLPGCLEHWIERDGLFCFKVKLTGKDLAWDLARLVDVALTAEACVRQSRYYLTADLNEQAPDEQYCVELMERFREKSPAGYESLLYIEQPTDREAPGEMHELSKYKPVLADESLSSPEMIDEMRRLGWSGVALKTCKCQSHLLLSLAKATEYGTPYSIQDLTNPGLALLHSLLVGAWTNPVMGIEYNSRQFYPHVGLEVQRRHPAAFQVKDGMVSAASLYHPGLGTGFDQIPDAGRISSWTA